MMVAKRNRCIAATGRDGREWENPTVHDDPDEPCEWDDSDPFCNCSAGHSIEEMDWNQCDSCGKPIYDEEPAVPPAPTFAEGTEK